MDLKQGFIRIVPAKDEQVDLDALTRVIREDIGFDPLKRIEVRARGSVVQKGRKRILNVTGSRQSFLLKSPVNTEGENVVLEGTLFKSKAGWELAASPATK